jgi:hypothetical protein
VQFLMRAAARSGHVAALSREILDRTSRGDLPPAAWQDALTADPRTHGGSYAQQWTSLHARWLGGVLQAAAGAPQEPALPALTPDDPDAWFQQRADDARQHMADALDTWASQLARAATGEVSRAAAGALSPPDGQLADMARLTFDLLNDLAEVRARHEEAFLRSVLAAGEGWNMAIPFVVQLAASTGDVASASITLTNTRRERIAVRCLVPDVRRADGVGPAFAARLTTAPERLTLEPGEHAGMRLSLLLDAASYELDALYVGTLQVTRDPGPPLHLPLRIVAVSRARGVPPRTDSL